MFSELHQGSPLFLLDKGTLTIKVAQVQSVSLPKPLLSQPFGLNNTSIDAVAVANGDTINLPGLPSNLSVATVNGIVVTETREAMASEVEAIQRMTQQVIDNYEAHKQTVERCTELLKELNPRIAREQQQEEKILQLEASLAEMKEMLAKALNPKSKKE